MTNWLLFFLGIRIVNILVKLRMAIDFSETLVVGISSRALFDLEQENKIFQERGVEEYRRYQRENEDKILPLGAGFNIVRSLLALNKFADSSPLVEVVVMSRNSPDTAIRVSNSIKHYELGITRSAFTGGEPLAPYIEGYFVDLFLSKDETDVQAVIDSEKAAGGLIYGYPSEFNADENVVKIAFDADAVVFSDESEHIYKTGGIDAFHEHEKNNENIPLKEGPYAKLIKMLSKIQKRIDAVDTTGSRPLRIAIVTARNSPSDIRVIKTLRGWGINVDASFFLGGIAKDKILKAYNAHIFFDDQDAHLVPASKVVTSCKVPYKSKSMMATLEKSKLYFTKTE